MTQPDPAELADALLAGDRRGLARAITLVESTRDSDRAHAARLLDLLAERSASSTIRIGLTGTPGVGKSTLIESLGMHLLGLGHRVAVLAVDPTSSRNRGSILGDKTRMPTLSADDRAFIRPSPSGGSLGGVARRTGAVRDLCEAAGYDIVLIETVGVGQSEGAVAELVDAFCLLVAPGGGDELQGVKRGVLELADLVCVNKADGPTAQLAVGTAADYRGALHLVRPKWTGRPTTVLTASALERSGVTELWDALLAHLDALGPDVVGRQRGDQAVTAFDAEVRERLLGLALSGVDTERLAELGADVRSGDRSVLGAAAALLD